MLQYSLRTLLLLTATVAVLCWLLFVVPSPFSEYVLSLFVAVVPGMVVAGVVYFRGYRQAFCIAAAPSIVAAALASWPASWNTFFDPSDRYPGSAYSLVQLTVTGTLDSDAIRLHMAVYLGVVVLSGVGGVLIRFLAVSTAGPGQPGAMKSEKSPPDAIVDRPPAW
jgi:hypothetical protein